MRNKMSFVVALSLATILSATPVMATETTESTTEVAAATAAQAQMDLSAMAWSDFAVSVNGTVLQFPTTFDKLAPLGLENDDDPTTIELSPNSYGSVYMKYGKGKIIVECANLDINTLTADKCIVTGITLENMWLEDETIDAELPGGIKYGESTLDDITTAWGPASDTYEGDLYTKLTYETDIYSSVEVQIDKETGKLNSIDIQNIKEPEDMEKGEVNNEVPASIANYQRLAALSTDLMAYEIQIQDKAYKLPVPVSVLIEDGWQLLDDGTDTVLPGKSFGWVNLMKDNQKMHVIARNYEADATVPQNGWIEEVTMGLQDANLEATLPGGIKVGMTKDECEKILKDSGVEYETDDSSSDFIHYSYGDGYGFEHSITVYTSEDAVYPTNTVITVECEHQGLED